jgi:predicted nuclease of predicted toxin-antitoxin system
MTIKILIDMNLSPDWAHLLQSAGWSATHWFNVGDPRATDRDIMDWAQENGFVLFTHDLDFGSILASTKNRGPSVIQIRTQNILQDRAGYLLTAALRRHESELLSGALLVVEESRNRIRLLPI